MTVVTALAVSWKPLMNSNAKAMRRAKNSKSIGPVARPERASQNDIGHPASEWRKHPHRVFRPATLRDANPSAFNKSSQSLLRVIHGTPVAIQGAVGPLALCFRQILTENRDMTP